MGDPIQSIIGNIGSYKQSQTNAKVSEANARVAEAQGKVAKAQAYGQASRIEEENTHAGRVASENLSRLEENKTKAASSVNAARGASGFTQQGSGSQPTISTLQQFEQAASDMKYSRTIQDVSARYNASMTRKSGDFGLMSAEASSEYQMAQAQVHQMMSDNARSAAITTAITTSLGAVVGGVSGVGVMAGANMGSALAQNANVGTVGTWESQQKSLSKNTINTMDKMLWGWLS